MADDGCGAEYLKIYHFKSTKSGLVYIVRVEVYPHHVYAVKFYMKSHRLSRNKYRLTSNTYEPRRIINTCINVMLSIYDRDRRASFGFIGANGLDENSTYCTKRFRVYSRIVATYFSNDVFYHKENKDYSAYMLVNQEELRCHPQLVEGIEAFFRNQFDYFD